MTHLSKLTSNQYSDLAQVLIGLIISIPLPGRGSSACLLKAVHGLLDFLYLAQFPVHSDETFKLLKDALKRFHDNKSIFEELGVHKTWQIPKLHFLLHYCECIEELGTLDNYNTSYTEWLYIDIAKDAYEATNHRDKLSQMTLWLECKEKMIKYQSYIKWQLARSPANYFTQKNLPQLPPRITITKHPYKKACQAQGDQERLWCHIY